jgi:hypothetical protein
VRPAPTTLETEIVITHYSNGWDDDWDITNTVSTVRELINEYSDVLERFADDQKLVDEVRAGEESALNWFIWDCLRETIEDCGDGTASIQLKETFDQHQKNVTRKKAEQAVAGFVARKNLKPDTIEFVLALFAEQDAIDYRREKAFGYECRAERFMESRFSGQSQEGFWSDEDSISTQFSKETENVELALDWLHEHCPLLMAQAMELRLQKENSQEEEVE